MITELLQERFLKPQTNKFEFSILYNLAAIYGAV